jgi:thiamine pyrophosphokinase
MSVRHALVLADGALSSRQAIDDAWPDWDAGVDWVVAADGGARHAAAIGLQLDLWVGDGDSLGEAGLKALHAAGVPIRRSPADKDESDTELALLAAVERDAPRITILGALGGARFDHALANVWLLDHPAAAGRDLRLVDAGARLRLIGPGTSDLSGRPGDLVSLIAFGGDAGGVTTCGLRYPLADERLPSGPSRGLSNVRASPDALLTVRAGRILVVETPATLRA